MPTYEYRCASCEHQFERFQRMSDEPVKECEVCGAPVQRLLFPVAIHFKGSGFYSTDYARRNTLGTAGTNAGNGGGSNGGGSDPSCGHGESAAEPAKPAATASSESPSATSAAKES